MIRGTRKTLFVRFVVSVRRTVCHVLRRLLLLYGYGERSVRLPLCKCRRYVRKIAENCSSVSSPYNGMIYVVSGKTVKQLNAETRNFTSYEISSSSPSDGRLSSAADCVLSGDTLVALDPGEESDGDPRLHVLSAATAADRTAKTLHIRTNNAKYIASDGKTACIATGNADGTLAVYDLSATPADGSKIAPIAEFSAKTEKRSSALRAFTAHITRLRARRSTPFFQTTLPQTKIFPIA